MGPIDFGKCFPADSDFIFYRIFIRLADNEDSHKTLDEFDFGSDGNIHMIVACPLVSHRHIMGEMFSGR